MPSRHAAAPALAERLVGIGVISVLIAGGVSSVALSTASQPASLPVRQPVRLAVATQPPVVVAPSPAPKPKAAPTRVISAPVAPAFPQTGCPTKPHKGGPVPPPRLPAPTVADVALPAPVPVLGKAQSLSAVQGKGLWATPWAKTDVDARALVAQARRTGVHSLWIRTGGSRQGYYGNHFLGELVPRAHAAGIAVIAWDFPFLSDPVADARRAHAALATGIDAFSPDVESAAEGTYATPRRLAVYLSLVRRWAGARPVVATVPRPSKQRWTYPYASFVPYADVFAPMVYWSCKEPGTLVRDSVNKLKRMLPVAPIGQAYDMGGEGGRTGTPSRFETLRFLDAARRWGGIGASLWTVEEAGAAQLQALADYDWATASHR
ncbi:MAG: Peptidoglycan-binding domain 1 protein [Frankiales bacterium]|nr:Peptidoglycan-binding domain 1 protein [Frankiales bacterium]